MAKSSEVSRERFRGFTERDAGVLWWRYGQGYVAELKQAWYRRAFRGGKRILDVGCGTGEVAMWADGADYFGIDLSEAWVRQGAAKPDRSLAVADVMHLPFPAGCFDRVVCVGMFHHLSADRVRPALREMARVPKPGGEMALSEPNPWNPLVRLFAYVRAAERGILHTSPHQFRAAVASVPEVRVTFFSLEYRSLLAVHLTFVLRRWPWMTSPGMTRFFRGLHKLGLWLMPRPMHSCTSWRVQKWADPRGAGPAGDPSR